MTHIASFAQILSAFSVKELSDALACPYQTAASMKRRGSVGIAHWPLLIQAARCRGIELDRDLLAQLAIRKRLTMIEVWSWPTPNGHKVHIALEELGLEYKVIPVNIGAGDQFKPEFLKITPNHRIPAIVDPDGPGGKPFTLFESAAILIYLSEKTGGRLMPKDPIGRFKCLEWMMFQMGGIGPMFGQWNHFANYAVEKIPYAIERYTNEVKRLHRVLDHRLAEAHWLAGDEYSMADIVTFPWIRGADRRGIDLNEFPGVERWFDEMASRPAVQRGVKVLADRARRGAITDAERENYFGKTQFAAR